MTGGMVSLFESHDAKKLLQCNMVPAAFTIQAQQGRALPRPHVVRRLSKLRRYPGNHMGLSQTSVKRMARQ
jgi:hypothetical protein